MRRVFAVLMGLAAASPAWAVGVGSSFGTGGFGIGAFTGGDFNLGDGLGYQGFGPSLDLHFSPIVLQLHVLELFQNASDGDLYIGANGYYQAYEAPIAGSVVGVVQPGLSVDFFGDPVIMALGAECRLGAQAAEAAGAGIYIVPAVGLVIGDGDVDIYAGGALQFSVWFGG